jgi:hypothetical protein
MKKLCFVAAVVLAALVAGCDGFMVPESGSGNLVKIVLEGEDGSGRSLIHPVAESDMDFIEVIFRKFDGTNYETYRQGWSVNQIGTIGVPEGFYITDSNCEAVIFGGLKDGKVLLAVGLVSKINNKASGDAGYKSTIEGGDSVTFKMAALVSSVSTNPGTTTFKVTAPTTEVTSTTNLKTIKNKGKFIPVFVLNPVIDNVTATYAFEFQFKDNSTPPTFGDYAKYVIKDGEGTAVRQMGTTLDVGYTKAAVGGLTTPNFFDDLDVLPPLLQIKFNTQDDGLCTIFLRSAVYMFGVKESLYYGDPIRHTKWYIQGGLDNSVLDDGSGKRDLLTNGTGGSILLGIGVYDKIDKPGVEVEIDW